MADIIEGVTLDASVRVGNLIQLALKKDEELTKKILLSRDLGPVNIELDANGQGKVSAAGLEVPFRADNELPGLNVTLGAGWEKIRFGCAPTQNKGLLVSSGVVLGVTNFNISLGGGVRIDLDEAFRQNSGLFGRMYRFFEGRVQDNMQKADSY